MCYVGEVSAEARRLCETTKQCMDAGIAQCRPGAPIRNIGKVGSLQQPPPACLTLPPVGTFAQLFHRFRLS